MKMIKNIIEYLIAISVIPAIVLTVISVTELKDVRNVQYELLSEEEGVYNITQGTFKKLMENKRIKKYEIESNYPLITQEEMDRLTWQVGDIKNEIYVDENGQRRIIERVGQVTFDGNEVWTDRLQGDMVTRFTLSKDHPIYNNYTNNYIVSSDLYLIRSDIDLSLNEFQIAFHEDGNIYIGIPNNILGTLSINDYLSQNPLTVTYEYKVKNPKSMVIMHISGISTDSSNLDYVLIEKPRDFIYYNSFTHDEFTFTLLGYEVRRYSDSIENIGTINADSTRLYFAIGFPKGITMEEARAVLIGKTLTYQLAQPRLLEEYDFSKFRLVFNKNRIRVIFDIDDGYYMWEITNDDKLIPITGRYDLGDIWAVKFYVYEIQQPLIRSLVLLIPIIVVSGLLYMFNKEKGFIKNDPI